MPSLFLPPCFLFNFAKRCTLEEWLFSLISTTVTPQSTTGVPGVVPVESQQLDMVALHLSPWFLPLCENLLLTGSVFWVYSGSMHWRSSILYQNLVKIWIYHILSCFCHYCSWQDLLPVAFHLSPLPLLIHRDVDMLIIMVLRAL